MESTLPVIKHIEPAMPESTSRPPQQSYRADNAAAARLAHLNEIGLALSAERDIDRLLELILTKSRELTSSDAGSVYLVQSVRSEPKDGTALLGDSNGACAGDGNSALYFCKAQNDSVAFESTSTFAVGKTSLAGYAALTGLTLNIKDVYDIASYEPYQFNNAIDFEFGYRTKSVLIVPMKNHAHEVVGVLQLINRKRHFQARLTDYDTIESEVLPFDAEADGLAASLASQAAVALENSRLLRTLEELFESFVMASASAFEDRDPCTSGHSQRVTILTIGLAEAATAETEGPYKDVSFSARQLKELRYAGLLHDFGKIGVRENILTKSHKLEPAHFQVVKDRVLLLRGARQLAAAESKVALYEEIRNRDLSPEMEELDVRLREENGELDSLLQVLTLANDPSITFLPDDEFAAQQIALRKLAAMTYPDGTGAWRKILDDQEIDALSVRKGSLTRDEFEQIQHHAQLSYEFLEQISWTPEYSSIPDIAHCHHEKLNGGGYPRGVKADQISLQSRMMTVADIYDALTANDRPYKKAMPLERALSILRSEAASGSLDSDIVDLFIAKEIYLYTQNWTLTHGQANCDPEESSAQPA